jgi:hypothetical protein
MTGGVSGVTGAAYVHIENLTQYAAPPASAPAQPVDPIPACPYPGLAYFGPRDASRFFGREQAIQALVAAVTRRSFTALVGASGSGKSSVVLAGLAPRLETQGGWRSTYFRIGTEPDKNPFAALARALSPLLGNDDVVDRMKRAQKLANNLASGDISLAYVVGQCRAANPGKRILLIADQFEEAFTLVPDDALRERFINALIEAFPDPVASAVPDVCLVLTLRADFYNAALRYRPLADRLQDHVENLGPMNRDELREAIVKPAEAVGVGFEPGLVNTILDDVEKRPGSLPLLQFALREMWVRLDKPLMTRAGYDAIGGVEGALAKRAQAIFDQATTVGEDEPQVALFRRLFTRLVTLGAGAEDTRRIVERDELGLDAWMLAQTLAGQDNRLVVTTVSASGQETVEVVHEALLRGWPALTDWIDRDRDFQLWLRQIKPRVEEWRAHPSDDGTLLRGGPLTVAEEWIERRKSDLSEVEKLYVQRSLDMRQSEQLALEADRARELATQKELLEAANKLAEEQRLRADKERELAENELARLGIEKEQLEVSSRLQLEKERRMSMVRNLFVVGCLLFVSFWVAVLTRNALSKADNDLSTCQEQDASFLSEIAERLLDEGKPKDALHLILSLYKRIRIDAGLWSYPNYLRDPEITLSRAVYNLQAGQSVGVKPTIPFIKPFIKIDLGLQSKYITNIIYCYGDKLGLQYSDGSVELKKVPKVISDYIATKRFYDPRPFGAMVNDSEQKKWCFSKNSNNNPDLFSAYFGCIPPYLTETALTLAPGLLTKPMYYGDFSITLTKNGYNVTSEQQPLYRTWTKGPLKSIDFNQSDIIYVDAEGRAFPKQLNEGHLGKINCNKYMAHGYPETVIATSDVDGIITIHNSTSPSAKLSVAGGSVYYLGAVEPLSRTGNLPFVVSASEDGSLRIWDTRAVAVAELSGQSGHAIILESLPGLFVTGSDRGELTFWQDNLLWGKALFALGQNLDR